MLGEERRGMESMKKKLITGIFSGKFI